LDMEVSGASLRARYLPHRKTDSLQQCPNCWLRTFVHKTSLSRANAAPQPPQPNRCFSGSVRTARGLRSDWRRWL